MSVVWKYKVPASHAAMNLPIPQGGKVLHVGQDPATGAPAIWARVCPDNMIQYRRIFFIGTDEEIPEGSTYLGTAICHPFVWHVFEDSD